MKKTLIAFAFSMVAGAAFAQAAPAATAAAVTTVTTATVTNVQTAPTVHVPRHEMSKEDFAAHKEHILKGREAHQRMAEKTTECIKGAGNFDAVHACFKAERDARPKLREELMGQHGPAFHDGHGPAPHDGQGPRPHDGPGPQPEVVRR